jgi:hypothetical protein
MGNRRTESTRKDYLERLQAAVAAGTSIIGAGAGTGISSNRRGYRMKLLYRVTFLTRIALILLLCSASAPLFAQASTGAVAQITGSVSDSNGGCRS